MKYLLPLLLLCACRTTSESESRVHATAAETLDTGQRVETHTEEAPGKTTVTVEEFGGEDSGYPGPVLGPHKEGGAESSTPIPATGTGEARAPKTASDRYLVKRTVTVEEHGAVATDTVSDLKSQQREDTALTGSAEEKSAFDFMHNPLMWIGAAVVLVVVLGTILYVVIKLRKVVPVP